MQPNIRSALTIGVALAMLGGTLVGRAAAENLPVAQGGTCVADAKDRGSAAADAGMVFVRGGTFSMGSNRHRPEERYTHIVHMDGFWIDRTEVTNAQFAAFVAATGYVTRAERGGDPNIHTAMPKELLVPGSVAFIAPTDTSRGGRLTQWFQYIAGADWRHPEGPGSSLAGREDHPVVHVAYEDALAYARWLGNSLPTEAQWEYAARGGRDGEDDWSSAFDVDGKPIANTWQGIFPVINSKDDGHVGTAPVGCFRPNGYGLYDMIGNVWEWTSDWYRPGHGPEPAIAPQGPSLADLRLATGQVASRVIKGGSYLCAFNYCARFRPAARQPQEVDLGAAHIGFRTVRTADPQRPQE